MSLVDKNYLKKLFDTACAVPSAQFIPLGSAMYNFAIGIIDQAQESDIMPKSKMRYVCPCCMKTSEIEMLPSVIDPDELKSRLAEARLVDVDDPYTVVCEIIDDMLGEKDG